MTNEVKDQFYTKVKLFEGYCSRPRRCPAGYPTIGYGHLIQPHETYNFLSRSDAFELLKRDFNSVLSQLSVFNFILQEHELYAIGDLVFNIGISKFRKGSLPNLLARYSSALDNGLYTVANTLKQQIANKLLDYCHYREPKSQKMVVSNGLKKRREFESKLFLQNKIY